MQEKSGWYIMKKSGFDNHLQYIIIKSITTLGNGEDVKRNQP